MATTPLDKRSLRPVAYSKLRRLGPAEDGAYVVPEDQLSHCRLLLSLGLSDNWQFDQEFAKLNPDITIVGVDHTVGPPFFLKRIRRCLWKIPCYALILHRERLKKYTTRLRNSLDYFSFFKAPHEHLRRRVAGKPGSALDISLGELLDAHPSSGEHDVFLKMDIEGSEYECIPDIIKHQGRIRCIAAEFHALSTRTGDFNQAMRSLLQHFVIVHLHGNNCSPYDPATDFPAVIEITLVNKGVIQGELSPSAERYPRPGLDFPNDSSVPDYELHFE